jgi:hypothetical protein
MKLFFPGTLHSMYTSILELCCVAQLETAFNPFFSVSSYNNLNSTFSTGQSWFGKKNEMEHEQQKRDGRKKNI